MQKIPKTLFSTCLSGSAKETELRIRNIFQWKKLRPPVWLIALIVLVIAGCGSLIAWRGEGQKAEISMRLQYYDELGNYAEIPQIEIPADLPEEKKASLIEINDQLGALYARYQAALENQDSTEKPFKLLCYPAASERYLSLLLYEEGWVVGRTAGIDIPLLTGWVYDQEEKQLVTSEQALELAAVTKDELLNQLNQEIDNDPMDPWDAKSVELQAFFLDQNEELTLYLVATMSGIGDAVYDRLYAWKQGTFTEIERIGQLTDDPILPPDATTKMVPALWNEWHYGSGQPDNGFSERKDIAGLLAPFEITESGFTQAGEALLKEYFRTEKGYDRVYFLDQEPGEPQEGDLRIDKVRYLGSEPTYETTGEAYAVEKSYYSAQQEQENGEVISKWRAIEGEQYIVMGRSMDGELYEVRGDRFYVGNSINQMILEESYGVADWEVTLWHDENPYPQPLALGVWNENALDFVDGAPSVEILDGWEPIYRDGDYWDEYTRDGITALRYYNSTEEIHVAYTIDMTRDDFATQRGIRVGSTRMAVEAAYPEAVENNYWGEYPDNLPLCWYASPEADLGPDILGPAILFFFEGDTVKQITLRNMFN